MRTKGDITVFSDGTMNVYNRSLAEELWYDYKDFAHRAAKYRKMNKKDAELSARRYERAAVFALCEFFCQVLGSWYNQGQEKGCFPTGTGEDILFVFRTFASTALGAAESNVEDSEFSGLYSLLERYCRHNGSVWEVMTGDHLSKTEEKMDDFLTRVESRTSFRRFTPWSEQTKSIIERLSGLLRRRD